MRERILWQTLFFGGTCDGLAYKGSKHFQVLKSRDFLEGWKVVATMVTDRCFLSGVAENYCWESP